MRLPVSYSALTSIAPAPWVVARQGLADVAGLELTGLIGEAIDPDRQLPLRRGHLVEQALGLGLLGEIGEASGGRERVATVLRHIHAAADSESGDASQKGFDHRAHRASLSPPR